MDTKTSEKRKLQLDKPVFLAGALIVFIPVVLLMVMGTAGRDLMNEINKFLSRELGALYLIMGLVAVVFSLYVAFSKFGKIKLGGPDAKPEYKFFTWAAMMFSMGIAASIFWAASSEWVYYITNPPLGIEPFSEKALDLAPALSLFHWGPTIWAIYACSAIVVAYVYQIKGIPELKISSAVSLAYADSKAKNTLNRIVDVVIIVSLVLSASTSLGLGTPFVSAAVSVVFGTEDGIPMRLLIMFIVIIIYAMSSTAGMKRGMASISDLNLKIAICLAVFVLLVGPTKFIIQSTITSFGLLGSEFITWSTWMEPNTTTSTFHADWTVFFWAWAAAAGLVSGAYISRISKGYSLKTMILGTIGFGTLGNALIIMPFANFGIDLYKRGIFDAPALFADSSANLNLILMTMFKENLPLATLFLILLSISCIVFMSTTFDAFSFSLGAFSLKRIRPDEEPPKWLKLFWALMIGAIPLFVILANGDLKTIQATALISGTFSMVLLYLMIYGFIRAVKKREAVFALEQVKKQKEYTVRKFEEEHGTTEVSDYVD